MRSEPRSGDFSALPPALTRRLWLAGTLAGCFGPARMGRADDFADTEPSEAESEEIKAISTQAAQSRLKPFQTLRTKHFLAIGNAPESYLRIALGDCDAIAADYMDHFQEQQFPVLFPKRRMTAVILEDERAYLRFMEGKLDARILGVYLRKPNRLVLPDYRQVPLRDGRAAALNLRTLAHETTHMLTFNTGLLNREGDVPQCIVEGFGMYGETRRPDVRTAPGQINSHRLDDLAHGRRAFDWVPVATLLTDDKPVKTGDVLRVLMAYAQSWLLVHYLMKTPEMTPKLRAYLAAIFERTEPNRRLDDATTHLGDLDRLDGDLKRYSIQLLNRR